MNPPGLPNLLRPALPAPSPTNHKGYVFGHLAVPYMLDEIKRKGAAMDETKRPHY